MTTMWKKQVIAMLEADSRLHGAGVKVLRYNHCIRGVQICPETVK